MTIPTSYTIRALNRWLAALKLETDSPVIRALHAAVDELDNDPNDLVADAEALLLAAASMSVLSFDALEHAAGEIGLEIDEEDRSEVRESATVMQGIADLLGEIRTRTAEDREVEAGVEGVDVYEVDARLAGHVYVNAAPFWVSASKDVPQDYATFMQARVRWEALTSWDAALSFFAREFNDLCNASTVEVWVQPVGWHGATVSLMSYTITPTEKPSDMTVDGVEAMMRATHRKVCDVEIVDEPAPGMTPPPQDVQDLLDEGSV